MFPLSFPHVAAQYTFASFPSTFLPHVLLAFTTCYPVYIQVDYDPVL